MRSILRTIFITLTFIAAVWMTASDVFMHVIHGFPKNSIQFTSTSTEQHFHFSLSATGTALLLWIALLIGGWLTKRWGKKQLQLGITVGILGTLPLLPFMNIGSKSIGNISHRFDIVDVLLVLLVVLVLLSKLTIWRYWWNLTLRNGSKGKKAGNVEISSHFKAHHSQVTTEDILKGIRELNLSGCPICVHSSLSSFGYVEGGARTVIDAFLAEGCTVMVPAFSWIYAVNPPRDMRPERNACDYSSLPDDRSGEERIYNSDSLEISDSMGAISATIVSMPDRVRGNHPLCSFAAVGPLAEALVTGQKPLDVYAPLKALIEMDGFVLLMGVELNKLTFIHLAEQMAGRNLFIRWANGPDGKPMMVEVGGCSDGFDSLAHVLEPIVQVITVGESTWIAIPAKEAIKNITNMIRNNPEITHCANESCERCADVIVGGPIMTIPSFTEC